MVSSVKSCLKVYCFLLGMVSSLTALIWVAYQILVISATPADQTDLLVARYLDISFGLLALTSALALIYGSLMESKTWLSMWTLGSATVMVGRWGWHIYQKYADDHPESTTEAQKFGAIASGLYVFLALPVLHYYRLLDHSIHQVTTMGPGAGVANSSGPPSSSSGSFAQWTREALHSKASCGNISVPLMAMFSTGNESTESDMGVVTPPSCWGSSLLRCGSRGPGHTSTSAKKGCYGPPNGSPSEKVVFARSSYCQIVTSEGYRITIPKDEDLYNPV